MAMMGIRKCHSLLSLRERLLNVSIHRIHTNRCLGQSNEDVKPDELPWKRQYYKYFLPIQTRWSDNDQYGHVNNAIYYSYFDTVINHYLVRHCGLNTDVKTSSFVGYMVDTDCTYRSPISFPEIALAGLAVSHIGRSSVRYTVAIFPQLPSGRLPASPVKSASSHEAELPSAESTDSGSHSLNACAVGHCVHVFVNTETNRPTPLPDTTRLALEKLTVKNVSRL